MFRKRKQEANAFMFSICLLFVLSFLKSEGSYSETLSLYYNFLAFMNVDAIMEV